MTAERFDQLPWAGPAGTGCIWPVHLLPVLGAMWLLAGIRCSGKWLLLGFVLPLIAYVSLFVGRFYANRPWLLNRLTPSIAPQSPSSRR